MGRTRVESVDVGTARSEVARNLSATTQDVEPRLECLPSREARRLGLVVIWWRGQPERLGEVLLPGRVSGCFGRGLEGGQEPLLPLLRQRPGGNEAAAPVLDAVMSRRQLRLAALEGSIGVECVGRRALYFDGAQCQAAELRPGDVIEVAEVCSFLCVERPERLLRGVPAHGFGAADPTGIVGESAAAWELRRRVRFAASRAAHVLITGPSGTGKELVARAIHALSARARVPMVARNAATLPPGLIDAELFGNAANYPNAGMPERPGLVGQAEGSTLFLDEIGELGEEQHAHLLRVLDGGEYQRLGEARMRLTDFRFLAATNRAISSLKYDLAARLALRVEVPGLEQRPEDIPLIARHLLCRMVQTDPELAQRYSSSAERRGREPQLSAELARVLTLHTYSGHVRELEGLLWRSLSSSSGELLECTREVRAELRLPEKARGPEEVSLEELRAALARCGGVKERAWRELGLSSRHSLLRLMRRLGET